MQHLLDYLESINVDNPRGHLQHLKDFAKTLQDTPPDEETLALAEICKALATKPGMTINDCRPIFYKLGANYNPPVDDILVQIPQTPWWVIKQ